MCEWINWSCDEFVCVPWVYSCLFSQGVIDLVLDCIDRLQQYSSASQFAEAVQGDTGEEWETILNCFYELLGKK